MVKMEGFDGATVRLFGGTITQGGSRSKREHDTALTHGKEKTNKPQMFGISVRTIHKKIVLFVLVDFYLFLIYPPGYLSEKALRCPI